MTITNRTRHLTTILDPCSDILIHKLGDREVRVYFAKVTPTIAERLLDTVNTQNRSPNEEQIARLTAAMQSGEFQTTHQGIAFDKKGIGIDLQHRLTAIVRSSTTQTFMVSEGWDPAIRPKIDETHRRQLKDNLAIMGVTARPDLVAIVVNALQRYGKRNAVKLTFEAAKTEIAKHKAGMNWLAERAPNGRGRGATSGAVIAAFVYAYPKIGSDLNRYWDDLQSGSEMKKGDAILALRDEIRDNRKGWHGDTQRAALFQKTLNALYLRHRDIAIKQLKVSAEAEAFFSEAHG